MKKYKRLTVLLLCSIMILSLAACNSSAENLEEESESMQEVTTSSTQDDLIDTEDVLDKEIDNEVSIYSLGETVATNIMEYTLANAELTVALVNSTSDPYIYFTPKEYDASKDAKNPYVASVGHTLAYFEIIVTNLDRKSISVGGFGGDNHGIPTFATVIIDDVWYNEGIKIGSKSSDGINWEKNETSNVLVSPSDTMYIRCYMDLPVEIEDLSEDFDITLSLSNSSDEQEFFDYHITSEAIAEQKSREISLEVAISRFLRTEGQEYFTNHLEDFDVVSGENITSVLTGKTRWDVEEKDKNGVSTWSGKFAFENDGKIKETIYDGSTGYFNNRKWAVDGDTIVLTYETTKGETLTDVCEMRKVVDGVYLFVSDGAPYILIQ